MDPNIVAILTRHRDVPSSEELQIEIAVRHELLCRLKRKNCVQRELVQLVNMVPGRRLGHFCVPSPEVDPEVLVLGHADLQFEV